jgi:four helix bundle protein
MAAAQRFQDLAAWQRCIELARVINEITAEGPAAQNVEFRDQIRDAADAAAPLIAEGFVRFTAAEFARYLRMARAELAEVQTHLEKVRGRNYFTVEQHSRAEEAARRAIGTTTNLLKSKLRQLDAEKKARRRRSTGSSREGAL